MITFDRLRNNIRDAVDDSAKRARFMVDRHASRGNFKSGDLAGKGYSEKWIPAFFLGSTSYSESGVNVSNYFTSANLPNKDIQWRNWKGKKTAFYTKGYKGFRKLTGRQTSTVDLTFSGQMLQSLVSVPRLSRNGYVIDVYVKGPYNDRMRWTNNRRQWLYLTSKERSDIVSEFRQTLMR